ncbi:MAG: DUF1254 domain-containing protein [Candidatus Aquilonibacter sp.]
MKPEPAAAQAYLYGFPLLLMDAAARRGTGSEGAIFNRFAHCFDLAETSLRGIVLPNRDLACSVAWLDLRPAPVILTSLPTDSYYVMTLIDAWSNVFATLGTRASGNAEHRFAIVGPNWTGSIPSNCTRVNAPTNLVCLVVQTSIEELSPALDLATLDQRYRLEPTGSETPRREPAPVLSDVDALSAEEAFSRIRDLMIDNPATRADGSAVEALDALRGHEAREATANAVAHARRQIDDVADTQQDGWAINADPGNYGTDYLLRARGARYNFLASAVHDVLCAQARFDTGHLRLTGRNNYLLHFDPWDEPPARAFWSLCAFDDEHRFTVDASAPATIDSREPLARRSNRSLDLHLAYGEPIGDCVQNWLGCPKSEFTLALRLYWPRPSALSGVWMPPNIAALSR